MPDIIITKSTPEPLLSFTVQEGEKNTLIHDTVVRAVIGLSHKKIVAIKLLRLVYNFGLYESKQIVEGIWAKYPDKI